MQEQHSKQDLPFVSFIIPCYNSQETLASCVEHLRAQDYPKDKIEIIVIDNGSEDDSLNIARSRADRVDIAPEASIARLRNLGAELSSGESLIFVDSDCLLHQQWLSNSIPFMRDPSVGMFGSKTQLLPENSTWVARAWTVHLDRSDLDPDPRWIPTRAVGVSRSAFLEAGGFNEDSVACEDVELGHKISQKYRIVCSSGLKGVHLREPSTLWALFSKELWRASDSLQTSFNYVRTVGSIYNKDMLSLALPFYFLCCLIGIALSSIAAAFAGVSTKWMFFFALMFFAPITVLSLDTARKTNQFSYLPGLIAVYSSYILARVGALFVPLVKKT